MKRQNIHTVYHALEARGEFESNPANMGARDQVTGESLYVGPQQYPKMLYHPQGELRETNPGEWVDTPRGPVLRGQQFEIITVIAKNGQEEKRLRAEGWHDHPAKAIVASGGDAPPIGADGRIAELERQVKELEEQKLQIELDQQRIDDLRSGASQGDPEATALRPKKSPTAFVSSL